MRELNRRDFLKRSSMAAGLATMAPLGACSPLSGPLPKGSRIAIVGGGLSGLACANGLFQRGYEVTLFEASERAGGRVHSLTKKEFEGAELGASFLHGGPENPLRRYCEKHSFKMHSFHHTDIGLVKRKEQMESLKPLRIHWEEFDILLDELSADPFIKTWLRCYLHLPFQTQYLAPILEELFKTTQRDLFQRKDIQKMLRHLTSQLFAADFEDITLQNYITEPRVDGVGYGPFAENEAIVSKGLSIMVEEMKKSLNIKYNHVLQRVDEFPNGLKLIGNWGESNFDFCVVCLPLGVLQNDFVKFNFTLPKPWTSAMENLYPGDAEKIVFKLPLRLLKNLDPQSLYFMTESDELFVQNLNSFKKNGVLVGYLTGKNAHLLHHFTKNELLTKYTTFFQNFFPDLKKSELHLQHSNWLTSKLYLGSYSSLGQKSRGLEHSAFRKKLHPNLLFAGEYAHPTDPGTMHGAYWSGLWAAEQILGENLGAF